MKLIRTEEAVGHVLCHDLTQIIRGEYKDARFRKGHVVQPEDIPVLLSMGKENLYVWEMTPGMVHENDAAERLCALCRGANMDRGGVKEGKIELTAAVNGVFRLHREKLVAINTRDAAIPDNEGNAFQGQPVVPGGGDGYFATAPVRQMVQAAAAQGIPCKLSYTAGAYVCNDLFYRLLHQYRGTGVLVDFIHVPFLPEQAKNGEPSMALADMARALEALILALEP